MNLDHVDHHDPGHDFGEPGGPHLHLPGWGALLGWHLTVAEAEAGASVMGWPIDGDRRPRFSERQPDHPAPNFLFSHGGPKYSPEPQISDRNREDPAR